VLSREGFLLGRTRYAGLALSPHPSPPTTSSSVWLVSCSLMLFSCSIVTRAC